MLVTGDFNLLTVKEKAGGGLILESDDGREVRLPKKETPKNVKPGDRIRAFVFLIQTHFCHTMSQRQTRLHSKVTDVTPLVLDWGIERIYLCLHLCNIYGKRQIICCLH